MSDEDLTVDIGDLELRNPTILAAGVLGLTGSSLKRVWQAGAGAVTTKSIGKRRKEGYPGPNVVQTPCGLVNSMGLPNPGIDESIPEIEATKESGATVIVSIFGEDPEEFRDLALRMRGAEVDALELNLSCPHHEEVSIIGHKPELARKVLNAVQGANITTWAKLPGNTHLSNLLEVARSVEGAGADAIVLTNTIPAMAIDARAERPILGHRTGGLSGPAIKPIGLRLVYEVYEEVDIPIIGAGGVKSGRDMIEYILAGASAVEIGTGIMWEDLEIFEKVCKEASSHLEGRSISDLVGLAHEG